MTEEWALWKALDSEGEHQCIPLDATVPFALHQQPCKQWQWKLALTWKSVSQRRGKMVGGRELGTTCFYPRLDWLLTPSFGRKMPFGDGLEAAWPKKKHQLALKTSQTHLDTQCTMPPVKDYGLGGEIKAISPKDGKGAVNGLCSNVL